MKVASKILHSFPDFSLLQTILKWILWGDFFPYCSKFLGLLLLAQWTQLFLKILISITKLFFRKITPHNLPRWTRACAHFSSHLLALSTTILGYLFELWKAVSHWVRGSQWPPKSLPPFFCSRNPSFPLGHMAARLQASLPCPPGS